MTQRILIDTMARHGSEHFPAVANTISFIPRHDEIWTVLAHFNFGITSFLSKQVNFTFVAT